MARLLPNWLQAYMAYTRHLEAPDPLHFWSGVSAIAGALRGKVFIDMGYWKWKPNFFIIFVAPPGIATKSTTINNAMALLRSVSGVHFGPDSATWQAVTDSFIEAIEYYDDEDSESGKTGMACITLAISELGTFLDPHNREMVDVLVDLWDGREVPWKRRTRMEGQSEIPSPWLNLIAATTPGWLAENFPQYAVTGGFTSRTVFVFADQKRHFVAYPKERISADDRQIRNSLIHDLHEIASLKGEYTISEEALEWGRSWYETHWKNRSTNHDSRLSGYLARKQTHIHKIAIILSAARKNELVIDRQDLEASEKILTAIEPEMDRAFETITDSPAGRNLQYVFQILRHHPGGISENDLFAAVMNHMSYTEWEETMKGLIAARRVTYSNKQFRLLQ